MKIVIFVSLLSVYSVVAAPQLFEAGLGAFSNARAQVGSAIGGGGAGVPSAKSNPLFNVGDVNVGGIGNANTNTFHQTGVIDQSKANIGK